MKKNLIPTLFVIILTSIVLLSGCSKKNCCYRITASNLEGSWLVSRLTIDGESEETGNSTFLFGKDGSFEHTSDNGTWEFGETRNVIKVATDTKAYDLNIQTFEENEMTIEKELNGKAAEYFLIRQ